MNSSIDRVSGPWLYCSTFKKGMYIRLTLAVSNCALYFSTLHQGGIHEPQHMFSIASDLPRLRPCYPDACPSFAPSITMPSDRKKNATNLAGSTTCFKELYSWRALGHESSFFQASIFWKDSAIISPIYGMEYSPFSRHSLEEIIGKISKA